MKSGYPDRSRCGQDTGSSDLGGWMARRTGALLGALRDTDDAAPCWTWWGEPRTTGAVARHQVQEAAVHRWDAEAATGTPAPLAPEVAHDGVGEFLEIMLGEAPSGLPGEVVLRSVDTDGEWQVGDPGAASVTIRGTASDLVLLLYGRISAGDVRIEGDDAVLGALLAAASAE